MLVHTHRNVTAASGGERLRARANVYRCRSQALQAAAPRESRETVRTQLLDLAKTKRPFVVGGFLMVTAGVLEALQVFTPDRHADFHAALYGACGALTQALFAALLIRVRVTYYGHYL